MTAKNAANLALRVTLAFVVFGGIGRTPHDLALISAGIVGVLVDGIWRLRP